MKNIIAILIVVILVSGAYGIRYAVLKCNADSYIDMANPDTNYGTATNLHSQVKFTYDGVNQRDLVLKFPFLRYEFPKNLIGKIKIREAGINFYTTVYKTKTPDRTKTTFGCGLYPPRGPWTESTLVFNNAPGPYSPTLFLVTTEDANLTVKIGWNKFLFTPTGVLYLQDCMEGINPYNGFVSTLEIGVPQGQTMTQGDYNHEMVIASREMPKYASNLIIGYDPKPGVILNSTKVESKSIGEIKAKYH